MEHTRTLTKSFDTTDDTAADGANNRCPECTGRLVADEQRGEQTCRGCGLVVGTDQLDRGPDWYSNDEGGLRRAGAPLTSRFADKGLSTRMGRGSAKAAHRATSGRRRRQLNRLRRRQQWCRSSAEPKSQRAALSEVRRISTALGLRGDVRDAATTLLSEVYEAGFFAGRIADGVAAAVVYATARMFEVPRQFTDVAHVSRVDETKLRRTYLAMIQECDLKIPPSSPILYLPSLASDLDLTNKTQRQARKLLHVIDGTAELTGRNPVGVAAMAIYVASCVTAEKVTQTDIAEKAGISTVTIRTTRNRVEEVFGKAPTTIITDADDHDECGSDKRS